MCLGINFLVLETTSLKKSLLPPEMPNKYLALRYHVLHMKKCNQGIRKALHVHVLGFERNLDCNGRHNGQNIRCITLQVGRCPQNVGQILGNHVLCFERDLSCHRRHNAQYVRCIILQLGPTPIKCWTSVGGSCPLLSEGSGLQWHAQYSIRQVHHPSSWPMPTKCWRALAASCPLLSEGSGLPLQAQYSVRQVHHPSNWPMPHKMLESSCGFMSFAFRGVWTAIAGTILSTSGASSFKLADAHKMLERPCASKPFAFRGIWAAIAGTTSRALVSASDRCAMLQSTLAHAWGFSSSLATISFTLWLSLSCKKIVLSPTSSSPLLFHITSLVYAAEAWK